MRHTLMFSALVLCVPLTAAAQKNGRIRVARAVELPRHAYPLSTTGTQLP